MAARVQRLKPCPPAGHSPAPYGTRGQCPTCKRRRCHGKARDGGRCRLFPVSAALVCRSHGAAKGTKGRAAADQRQEEERTRRAAVKLLGLGQASPSVDYREVLMGELATWHVIVGWYRGELAGLDRLTTSSERGESAAGLVLLHDRASEHLLRVVKACHEARIDQQMMDLARAHADQTDRIIHALLRGLGHDPQEPEVRQVVRAALTLVEGGLAS